MLRYASHIHFKRKKREKKKAHANEGKGNFVKVFVENTIRHSGWRFYTKPVGLDLEKMKCAGMSVLPSNFAFFFVIFLIILKYE